MHEKHRKFVTQIRVDLRICEILSCVPENSERSVGEIAYACGFTYESYFCRCYKKQFGTTPRKRGTWDKRP